MRSKLLTTLALSTMLIAGGQAFAAVNATSAAVTPIATTSAKVSPKATKVSVVKKAHHHSHKVTKSSVKASGSIK